MNKQSLNGTWKVFIDDGQRGGLSAKHWAPVKSYQWFDFNVPGEVHNELQRLEMIDDFYDSDGFLKSRWVEECIYTYRREIEVTADMLAGNSRLVFEGLCLGAQIYLNGEVIGEHHNYFYPCKIDITGRLKEGVNVVMVHLQSGLFDVAEKPMAQFLSSSYEDSKLFKRVWLRAPQCQFGWDWSQRFLNVGMHGDVYIEYNRDFFLDDLAVTASVSDDMSEGEVTVVQHISGVSADCAVDFEVAIDGEVYEETINVGAGTTRICKQIKLVKPRLWYPRGYGKAELYDVVVSISTANGAHEMARTVGFRKCVVNQSKHPQRGQYFIFEINDIQVFCKGGNFVPADMNFFNITQERYRTLIDRAIEANFNFLRKIGRAHV